MPIKARVVYIESANGPVKRKHTEFTLDFATSGPALGRQQQSVLPGGTGWLEWDYDTDEKRKWLEQRGREFLRKRSGDGRR